MAKDINIHLKTHGAERTKQQLGGVAQASKQVGDKTAEGHRKGADAVDKTTQKMTGMGRVLGNLKSQVLGFIGGFLGLQAVMKLVDYLQQKLQRIQQIQQQIYDKTISLAGIGQALEFQTGTLGQQQFWTQQALQLQAAGGLASPEVAQQMMISMDIAFQKQGGIRSQQIQDLAKQLAPFVGAAGLGPQEVAKLFEFAGTAGIEPTEQAYKEYFAKLHAGYTASKATDFGQYMEGLQKGGTAYMSMGGTLEEALSAFASARSVMPNAALAATLLEQVSRLSSGAYAKPRQAIEKKMGVSWENLSMDERMKTLLSYVETIPESRRGEVLAEQGFPVELTTQMGKMVTPEAKQTMEATREQVANATAAAVDQKTKAYMESMLAEQRKTEARTTHKKVKAAPGIADWKIRKQNAQTDLDILLEQQQDSWVKDSIELYVIALETLESDISKAIPTAPKEVQPELRKLHTAVKAMIANYGGKWTSWRHWPGDVEQEAITATRMFKDILRGEPFKPPRYSIISQVPQRREPKIEAEATESDPLPQKIGEGLRNIYLQKSEEDLQPAQPAAKVTETEIPVQLQPPVPFPPEPTETEVEAPVRPAAKVTETEIPVQLQPQQAEETPPVVTNTTHYYDYGIHYYPRVGDDESGPRIRPGVMA